MFFDAACTEVVQKWKTLGKMQPGPTDDKCLISLLDEIDSSCKDHPEIVIDILLVT